MTKNAELAAFQHWRDEGLAARGFDRWKELRALAPRLFHMDAEKPGRKDAKWWYFLTYEDIRDAFMHPDPYSSGQWQAAPEESARLIPVGLDPPEHGKYRKMLMPFFAPREIKRREEQIRIYCRSLIEDALAKGECDFVKDFSVRYPTAVFVGMAGLPLENLSHYVELVHTISQTAPDEDMDGSRVMAAEAKIMEVFAHYLDLRRKDPGDDLMSFLLAAEVEGEKLSQIDLLATCMLLLRAGLDTVASQLGFMFLHLAQDPALRQRIREHPEDIQKIIDEMMRYYSITMNVRTLTKDITLGETPLHSGDRVILPVAAANRDPAKFERPDEFDPDRPHNPHLGFGTGPHACLGVFLARSEMRIALEEWHKLIPDYRIKEGTKPEIRLFELLQAVDNLILTW